MFSSPFSKLSIKNRFALASLISAGVLGCTLIMEYILKIPVCPLCSYERYPYIIAIIFGLFGLYFHKNQSALRFARAALITTFFISLCLAVYHVMIEHHLIPMPEFCKVFLPKDASLEQLKAFIMNQKKFIPCNQVSMRILFLSLAEWNAVTSFFMLLGSWKLHQEKK